MSCTHPFARLLLVALAMTAAMTTLALPSADAHRGDQSYLYLDVGDGLGARLQMPLLDVRDGLGIELTDSDGEPSEQLVQDAEDALRAYALEHVAIEGPDGPWELTPTGTRLVANERYVEVAFDVDHGDSFREFTATLDPFFDEIDDRDALLLVANDLAGGVIENEAEHLVRFTPDDRQKFVDLGNASQWTNFTASVAAGVDHIRTGPDHILFIFALLIPSVLVWAGSWKPATGFGATLWRITKILSMFTLAHSVTFTLAGIGLLPSPGAKVTETIIALSIAATALHTLRPIFTEREWVLAFVFGLFHGFGFASLVNDLEVSTGTQLVSLLGRNVGIELGQLVVVLLVFPALFLLRSTPYYRWFLIASSVLLIVAALMWMFERVAERDLRLTKIIDELLRFPRSLVLVLLFTVVAGALRWRHEQS